MYQDILTGPSRKTIYRIYGWLQIIAGAVAAYIAVTQDTAPKWTLGVAAVLTLVGSQLNFTSSDNTPPSGVLIHDLESQDHAH